MTLRLPIGIDNFRFIRENGAYYVDKTAFISELVAELKPSILVTRPRRVVAGLMVAILLRPLPKIAKLKTVDELFGGDFVLVDGERVQLLGAMYFSELWNGWTGHFKVAADQSGNPARLFRGGAWYSVRRGGVPLRAQDLSASAGGSDPLAAFGVVGIFRPSGSLAGLDLLCLKREADTQPRTPIRLWRAKPTPSVGQAPLFTVDSRPNYAQSVVPDQTPAA